MAVPGRTNEDDFEEDNALFEEEGFLDDEEDFDHSNTPPHLTALVSASQLGDVAALRHALGIFLYSLSSLLLYSHLLICFWSNPIRYWFLLLIMIFFYFWFTLLL